MLSALRGMFDEGDPLLRVWISRRRPAGATPFFSTVLPGRESTKGLQPAVTGNGSEPTHPEPSRTDPSSPEPSRTDPNKLDPATSPADQPTAQGVPVQRVPADPVAGIPGEITPDTADPVPVGSALDGTGRIELELESLRKHVAVFAGSDSGKTVLLRRIIEECALRGVSSIVLDPNGDLARLGDPYPSPPREWHCEDSALARTFFDTCEVVVWTPLRTSGRPLTFQPLPDFTELTDDPEEFNQAVQMAVDALAGRVRADGTTRRAEIQRAVLKQSVEFFARSGGGPLQALADLMAELPEQASDLDQAPKIAGELAQTLRAAMVNDPLFGGAGTPVDPGLLLRPTPGKRSRISVISLIGLEGDAQRQSFVSQLQMALFGWFKRNPARDVPLGGLLVMDEAQTIAPSGAMTPSTQSTLALASQARKYGLGLLFATQAPKGLHKRIPGNAATQVYGRLNSPAQIQTARELARGAGGDVSDIGTLTVGQFYVAVAGRPFIKVRTRLPLSHDGGPLSPEEVLTRAQAGMVPG